MYVLIVVKGTTAAYQTRPIASKITRLVVIKIFAFDNTRLKNLNLRPLLTSKSSKVTIKSEYIKAHTKRVEKEKKLIICHNLFHRHHLQRQNRLPAFKILRFSRLFFFCLLLIPVHYLLLYYFLLLTCAKKIAFCKIHLQHQQHSAWCAKDNN